MENFDKQFSSIFEGIHKTMDAIDRELDLLKHINEEQKVELKKAKHFNVFMLVIALVSLAVSVISVIVGFTI